MHATIYGRGQMVIPARARKQARIASGDVVSVQPEGDGRIMLIRLEKPKSVARPSKAKLRYRKNSHAVIVGGRKPTDQELRSALAEFP
jgi:AbrB family looped-hinge helix DNA binding protein